MKTLTLPLKGFGRKIFRLKEMAASALAAALLAGCNDPTSPNKLASAPDENELSVAMAISGSNLVGNGGFENGITGWTDWGGLAAGLESTDFHSGTKAVKISMGDGGGGYNVTASGQTSVSVGAWTKVSVAGEAAYFGVDFFNSSGSKVGHKAVGPFGSTTWTYNAAVTAVPTGTAKMTVWVYHNPGSGAAFFDDVELYNNSSVANYTITASAGTGGSISPTGSVSVASGANQTFTIAPSSGYSISAVTVDGVNKGAVSTYTFSAVSAAHTISASFASVAANYTITASAGAGGSISPSGSVSVASGANQTFTIAPSSGYSISAVTVDGVNKGAVSTYTFSAVSAAHTISASFAAIPVNYTITASAGANGSISPSGSVSVASGANQTFTITAASGYGISAVTVDGVNKGAVSTYTFSAVSAAHTISATFAALPPPPTGLDAASTKAYNWMVSTKTPSGFYLSQSDDVVCYTYDQAVTVVAFLIKGDTLRARQLLEVLQAHQEMDGSWYTGFSTTGAVSDGNQKWLGPMMWVDIAAANYRKYTGSTQFDAMAKKDLDHALTTQASNGALEIGQGQGVEENSDAYAALMAFGYTTQAAKVASFINSCWNTTDKRYNAGAGDPTVYLDPQTWSNQSLGSVAVADAPKALDYVMTHLRCTKSNLSNTFTVDGFDFNNDLDDIWLEGTGQMAAAFYTVGRATDGDYFAAQVAKSQSSNGAIPYSVRGGTTGDGWNMTTAAALSSSGWFIIAVAKANPFH